jgi:hypothetical protein
MLLPRITTKHVYQHGSQSAPITSHVSITHTPRFKKLYFPQTAQVLSQPPASTGVRQRTSKVGGRAALVKFSPSQNLDILSNSPVTLQHARQCLLRVFSWNLVASCSDTSTWAIRRDRLRLKSEWASDLHSTLSLARHFHAKRQQTLPVAALQLHHHDTFLSRAAPSPHHPAYSSFLLSTNLWEPDLHPQIAARRLSTSSPTQIHTARAPNRTCPCCLSPHVSSSPRLQIRTRAAGSTNESTDPDNNWSRLPRQHLPQHTHPPRAITPGNGPQRHVPATWYASVAVPAARSRSALVQQLCRPVAPAIVHAPWKPGVVRTAVVQRPTQQPPDACNLRVQWRLWHVSAGAAEADPAVAVRLRHAHVVGLLASPASLDCVGARKRPPAASAHAGLGHAAPLVIPTSSCACQPGARAGPCCGTARKARRAAHPSWPTRPCRRKDTHECHQKRRRKVRMPSLQQDVSTFEASQASFA